MIKLFWYIYARITRWYLYRGDIPIWNRIENYHCPTCYWDALEDNPDYQSKNYLGMSNYQDCMGSQSWFEHYKCPRCGTRFEFIEGN